MTKVIEMKAGQTRMTVQLHLAKPEVQPFVALLVSSYPQGLTSQFFLRDAGEVEALRVWLIEAAKAVAHWQGEATPTMTE